MEIRCAGLQKRIECDAAAPNLFRRRQSFLYTHCHQVHHLHIPGPLRLAILTAVLYQDLTWRFERIGCAAIAIYTLLTLFIAPGIMLHRSGKEAGQALARMDTTGKTIAFLHDYRTSTVFYSGQTIYRAEPANKIDGMKPGALSWNAKNVMPFIAEEEPLPKRQCDPDCPRQEPCLIRLRRGTPCQ